MRIHCWLQGNLEIIGPKGGQRPVSPVGQVLCSAPGKVSASLVAVDRGWGTSEAVVPAAPQVFSPHALCACSAKYMYFFLLAWITSAKI